MSFDFSDPVLQATLWTFAIAALAAVSCALVGSFLVLRRLSLLGDAISHAVLPGLVLGFVFSGSRELFPMLLGAVLAGFLTTFGTELLRRRARIEASAGMGIVFTTLFAIGVILITIFARDVDLDPGCVLYGALGTVALDTTPIGGMEIPRAMVSLSVVLGLNVLALAFLWKEFKISAFDPALSDTLGISSSRMHYALMILVAVTTVACFEAVGSILVIALLVVPAATARLLTDRLALVIALAAVIGVASAAGGVYSASQIGSVREASMIAIASGVIFAVAVVASPRYGLLVRVLRRVGWTLRVVGDDILGRLYREEENPDRSDLQPIHGPTIRRVAEFQLQLRGDLARDRNRLTLTESGRVRARRLVRSHRLWEKYLADRLRIPADHVHEPAHRMEHYMSREFTEQVLERLGETDVDPHGRAIPPEKEEAPKEEVPKEGAGKDGER